MKACHLLWTLFAALLCTALFADEPSNCRLYLASQYDWGTKAGFYLDMEGGKLETLPVILGVADGKEWRFVTNTPGFVVDREYQIHAIVKPDGTELYVDGKKVAQTQCTWKQSSQNLAINDRPEWANGPGDWLGVLHKVSIVVSRDGKETRRKDFEFGDMAERQAMLRFFQPGQSTSTPFTIQPDETVTVDVSLKFAPNTPKRYAPFIDKYGQCRYADFPGKIRSDEDLKRDIAAEDAELAKMPPSRDIDQYGGYLKASWREKPTGFYRVVHRNGRWWLITPTGTPCFYTGVGGSPAQIWELTPVTGREFLYEWLPPKGTAYDRARQQNCWGTTDGTEYYSFYASNLLRKYGESGWETKPTERAVRRMKAFGLGGGKWGSPKGMPDTPVLGRWETPNLAGHPDVFDPAVCEALKKNLEKQISPRLNDPLVLGWSLGNEYDEIIKRDEVKQILAKPGTVPAKRALVDYALEKLYNGELVKLTAAWKIEAASKDALYAAQPTVPAEDIEKLRCYYEDRYYETVYRTIKALDPNHLFLGNWIVPGWWESEDDWRIVARHCDVIGYDRYAPTYADERLLRLQTETDKPTLCGEFSHPAWYGGERGFGRYGTWAKDEAESGELYRKWVRDAAYNPHCIGLIWFMWRDQPLTGRGPGRGDALVYGEHYAFGVITEQDRVKWPLVRQMRDANLKATRWRLEASR